MDKAEILQTEYHFQPLTFHHLSVCLDHYERGERHSSGIMASVFAEALLKDIGIFYGITFSKQEPNFKTMIEEIKSKIRGMADVSSIDKNHIINLASRCNEIREKRNRLVHNTGVEHSKIDIDQAADDMHHNAIEIVEYYMKTSMASELCKQAEKNSLSDDLQCPNRNFSVFVSTITPHSVEQEIFLNAITNQLSLMGITPVKCTFDDYDKNDPMEKVRKTIEACDAFLVIGLERSHTYLYRDKEHSKQEKEGIHRKHTSGWLHIESGIAFALRKKIFVMCHEDIYGDGIFDRNWNSYPVVTFNSPLDVRHKNVKLTLSKIDEYAKSCLDC